MGAETLCRRYANAELIELIAEYFHCGKSAVVIKSGASSRVKLLRVDGA